MIYFFKQKTAYEMRISDWSSDVCSSDLLSLAGMEQQNLFVSENISRIEEEIVKFQAELEELDKNRCV